MAYAFELSSFLTSLLRPGADRSVSFSSAPSFIEDSISWKECLRLAEVAGGPSASVFFALALDRAPWKNGIPDEIKALMDEKVLKHRLKLAIYRNEAEWLFSLFSSTKISVLFSGGLDLGVRFYRNPFARPVDSIDILVQPGRTFETLRELGRGDYRQTSEGQDSGYSRGCGAPRVRVRTRLAVADSDKETETIFHRAESLPLTESSRRFSILSPTDCAVDLFAAGAGFKTGSNPIWLNDLYNVLNSGAVDWEILRSSLESRRLLERADQILDYLDELGQTTFPASMKKGKRRWLSPFKKRILGIFRRPELSF